MDQLGYTGIIQLSIAPAIARKYSHNYGGEPIKNTNSHKTKWNTSI